MTYTVQQNRIGTVSNNQNTMKKHLIIPLGIILLMIFNAVAFAVEIEPGGFDYNNNRHGFYIVLPAGWDDYTVTEETLGDETYFDFFLPTTDTSGDYPDGKALLFTITATEGDPIEMAEFLGENSVYEFYFSHLNGFPPADLEDRVLEFDQIKSTFSAFEPTGSTEPLGAFSDTGGHMYDDAINYVKMEGIVEGYPDGTYKPDSPINRAEFTKILLEANTTGVIDETYSCFPDVPMDQWYTKYVCLAKMMGIISGYPDGDFKPDNNINLVEALKIIFETRASVEDKTINPVEGEWYQVYIDMAYDEFLLDTIDADPAHLLTRGEMAELIYLMAAEG